MRMVILLIFGALCLAGILTVARYALTYDKPKKEKPLPEPPPPLPGGGGVYTLVIEGMETPEDEAAVGHALAPLCMQVTVQAGTAEVKYQGIPAIDFLDSLRNAVQAAGYAVTEIR
ncbi:MAG: hypothetical protein IJV58_03300 [Oscillospiraceae bacterium]|nr:hypothetical protein [Oscillospiraceae bacterium]